MELIDEKDIAKGAGEAQVLLCGALCASVQPFLQIAKATVTNTFNLYFALALAFRSS
jgi:hypothetical protein